MQQNLHNRDERRIGVPMAATFSNNPTSGNLTPAMQRLVGVERHSASPNRGYDAGQESRYATLHQQQQQLQQQQLQQQLHQQQQQQLQRQQKEAMEARGIGVRDLIKQPEQYGPRNPVGPFNYDHRQDKGKIPSARDQIPGGQAKNDRPYPQMQQQYRPQPPTDNRFGRLDVGSPASGREAAGQNSRDEASLDSGVPLTAAKLIEAIIYLQINKGESEDRPGPSILQHVDFEGSAAQRAQLANLLMTSLNRPDQLEHYKNLLGSSRLAGMPKFPKQSDAVGRESRLSGYLSGEPEDRQVYATASDRIEAIIAKDIGQSDENDRGMFNDSFGGGLLYIIYYLKCCAIIMCNKFINFLLIEFLLNEFPSIEFPSVEFPLVEFPL